MRVIVTGGSGFIGSHLVDKLRDANYSVIVVDKIKPHRDDVVYFNVDILDYDNLLKVSEGVDYIFHLAAISNVNIATEKPIYTVRNNIEGTSNILEISRQNKIKRVIFASTVWIYGGAKDIDVNEDSPFFTTGAGHIYTSTKISSELICHDYAVLYKQDFTILRYGIPYGPRARAGTVIPIFVDKALRGEPITIAGDGNQYRNFIYVDDLVKGNVLALREVAKNKTYNLDGREKITIRQIAETINRILNGKVTIEYTDTRTGDYQGKEVSSALAQQDLGWQPEISFEEGMRLYIHWYKEYILKKK